MANIWLTLPWLVSPGRCAAAVCAGRLGRRRLHDGRAGWCHQAALERRRCASLLQPLARVSAQRLGSIVSHPPSTQTSDSIIARLTRTESFENSMVFHTPGYVKLLPSECKQTESVVASSQTQAAQTLSYVQGKVQLLCGLLDCQYLPSSTEQGFETLFNLWPHSSRFATYFKSGKGSHKEFISSWSADLFFSIAVRTSHCVVGVPAALKQMIKSPHRF